MKENPLLKLRSFGQSIWLDYIRRRMLVSGKLALLIEEDGLAGLTSNPSIFEKAIAESDDYDDAILSPARAGKNAVEIYEELVVETSGLPPICSVRSTTGWKEETVS